jgi:hypothetical protein
MKEYHQDHDMMHLVLRLESKHFTHMVSLDNAIADNEELIYAALQGSMSFQQIDIVI